MPKAVEDGPFQVADFDGLLFCNPVFCSAKTVLGFHENKSELVSVQCLIWHSFGAGDECDKLGLRHHAVKFHRAGVGNKVGSVLGQIARDQIGIA
jgi:hypothetical protein